MKIASNQPYKFALSGHKTDFCFLDSPEKDDVDIIVLMCADIFGAADEKINEMRKLTELIKEYPKSVPCFLLGVKTMVPNKNWEKYIHAVRDNAVRAFLDEILSRCNSIGVTDQLTYEWLTEFLGYPKDAVQVVYGSSLDETTQLLEDFYQNNDINFFIDSYDVHSFYSRWPLLPKSIFYESWQKELIISHPRIEAIGGGKIRYCADIKNIKGGQTETLWLEAEANMEKYLLLDRCDAFLLGVLPFALRYNHDIVCESPITEEFYYNLTEILIPHLIKYDKSLNDISIRAELDNTYIGGAAVGTAVSGGVDSFYTIQKHFNNEKFPSLQLTHLYVGNYLYSGEAKERILERAENTAADLGLPLIKTDTNITMLFDEYILHLYYHSYKTLFGVLCLRKFWKTYYYSSAFDFGQFDLHDNGRKDTAYYDLLLCDVLSVPGFRVISGGAKADRMEKVKSITEFPITYKYLNVCLEPKHKINCTKCEKCCRTIFNLEMFGKLDLYKDVFDLEDYKMNKVKAFEYLIRLKDTSFYQQAYEYFLSREPELIKEAEMNVLKTGEK